MSYSVCIMDDNIPVSRVDGFDDTKVISFSMLKYLLQHQIDWEENELKELVSKLVENKNISILNAFHNPSFFLDYSSETAYVPEAIIYDWNYKGLDPDDSKELLVEILKCNYAIVFIYTREDQSHEIDKMIAEEEFKDYQGRLSIIHKESENSVDKLLCKLKEKNEENFSFRFGKLLRNTSQNVINNILVQLGRASVDQIGHFLNFDHEENDNTDLFQLIGERFKNQFIVSEELKDFDFQVDSTPEEIEELAPKIWSQRLYNYYPTNKRVQMGDIIKKEDELFIVLSADCDLRRHWHKNFGYVSLIPLHKISKDNEYLKSQLELSRTANQLTRSFRVSSFSNKIDPLPEGQHLLPFLRISDCYSNFILFAKELRAVKIDEPSLPEQGHLKREYLKYGKQFEYEKIATVSEPFLSPLVQNIIRSISGFGSPNIPEPVHELISKDFKEMFS